MSMRLGELAARVGGRLEGEDDRLIEGVAVLESAGSGDLSICAAPKYRGLLAGTAAAAVLVSEEFEPPDGCPDDLAWIRVENPHRALATALRIFHPEPTFEPGIDPTAVVAESARLGADVRVGAGAVIGPEAMVGERCVIGPGSVLDRGVSLGRECRLFANVSVQGGARLGDRVVVHAGTVIGSDGFGYVQEEGRHVKIPQVGGVEVGDDVEIGANVCIDRGTMGDTRIGAGTKIDNLVQIGHNCRIGENCILCGQVGLSGSTVVGDGVMMGGQSGAADHVTIGDGARVAARAAVLEDVEAGSRVAGYPAIELPRWRRSQVAFRKLPDLVRRLRRVESGPSPASDKEKQR